MEGAAVVAEAPSNRVQLETELRFESEDVAPLSGWRAGGANVQLTDEHVKDGRYAARISHSSSAFGGIVKSIERDFVGDTLTVRGWMRADAGELPVVWLRSDGIDAPVDYANSRSRAERRRERVSGAAVVAERIAAGHARGPVACPVPHAAWTPHTSVNARTKFAPITFLHDTAQVARLQERVGDDVERAGVFRPSTNGADPRPERPSRSPIAPPPGRALPTA